MKQVLKKILASIIVISAASAAQADIFNFSYTFLSGNKVTGSFDGTLAADGNVVTGLSNISIALDGVAFISSGSLYGSSLKEIPGQNVQWVSGGAVASLDGTLNNFMFTDIDYPVSDTEVTNKFTVTAQASAGGKPSATVYVKGNWVLDGDITGPTYLGFYTPDRWEMSVAQVSAVPEPETYALMLSGLGCIGLISRRRKFAQTAKLSATPRA